MNNTITNEVCQQEDKNPQAQVDTHPGGVANGYVCSRALKDEMKAIIGACMPYAKQNTYDDCGSYLVELT